MKRVSRLNRAAVFVSDLDRSEAFYRDVLGLRTLHTDENLDSPLLAKVLQAPKSRSSKVRFRFLKPDAVCQPAGVPGTGPRFRRLYACWLAKSQFCLSLVGSL